MRVSRKIIEIDEQLCDGCGQCVPGVCRPHLDSKEGDGGGGQTG